MPLVQTRGAASAQGFGEFAQATAVNYIEDVFSTYLYTGTGASQTITNNIDLSTKGGLVWLKNRDGAPANNNHNLVDTTRGISAPIYTNSSGGQLSQSTIASFNTTGFSMGAFGPNAAPTTYCSWTFRKQPKFFDVVTYTGTGSNTTISHNLGSVPGCIIVKRTDTAADWAVYHRSLANTQYLVLNTTAAAATGATWWNSTTPTSSVFSVGTDASVNASGGTYVAYVYAHNAGGFGLTGTDNVISCGSYTTDGSGFANITLGYEPQWVLIKRTDNTGDWELLDSMRGFTDTGLNRLFANNSGAEEVSAGNYRTPTATGFYVNTFASATYIYIAIRRGPMKVPTDATKVYYGYQPHSTGATIAVGFPSDFVLTKQYDGVSGWGAGDRLRGNAAYLIPNNTNAEASFANTWGFTQTQNSTNVNYNGANSISYFYRRAPSFFDEVCYTGTGSATTFSHNLGVVPELIIVKRRDTTGAWDSYSSALANTEYVVLNTTAAKATGATRWNSTTPTSSVFSVGTSTTTNASAGTYVAYLFATCAGVSKVGSYTGNGTTQTINCGFGGGARFVLIKRTDSTGGWYVYDTARGMTVLTDPYLFLNTTAAEVATLGSVITVSTGFALDSAILADINVSAATYIFLAIA